MPGKSEVSSSKVEVSGLCFWVVFLGCVSGLCFWVVFLGCVSGLCLRGVFNLKGLVPCSAGS